MKPLLLLLFIITFSTANATTYYFSTSGNDANNGTSTSTPWQTVSKFNAVFASKAPGDYFLFKRGDVFYGSLNISRSGLLGAPITIGAYGTGANPVITGLTTVSSWTNLGGNIWESTSGVSGLSAINMVVIKGINTPMGRYPNTGYLPYQSFSGKTSITSSSLSGTPNWTGAEAVIRKQRWVIDRNLITAHSGGTLTYTSSSNYNGQANYGFFIQNDSRTLDQQNEWYYSPSTKKIRVYSTTIPTSVQVATRDTLVSMKFRDYITFDNLSFEGSNKDAFVILSSSNVTIQNCSIDYSGKDAIWGGQNFGKPSSSFVLKNSTLNHTNNNSVKLESEFAGALISNNTIKNTGMIVGMGGSGDCTYEAVQTRANNVIVEYNKIDSVGYIGIRFYSNNTIIRNNVVNGFCFVKLDGAGIYTWVGTGSTPYTGQKVLNNIVLNGYGDNAGTTATGNPISHGIYIDDWAANVEVTGNTMASCSYSGLYIHNAHDLIIRNNTSFNNGMYQALVVSSDAGSPIRRATTKNNIFVANTASQLAASYKSRIDDVGSFGSIDSNYYAKPINDNVTIYLILNNNTKWLNQTLAQWQAYSGLDALSKKSPKAITTANDLRFEYNTSSSNKTISLDGNYIDVKNVSYNGSITLGPYNSAVLIRNGVATNKSPIADAGTDKTSTISTNEVNLLGTGTDPDGSISGYNWAKISGPSGGTITNASSAATTVTSLLQGVYKFELKVTDNNGATGRDTMVLTVNAANVAPTANTGADQVITLPTNTINLSGSGTDADGSISAYLWTKISGGTSTITNATSAATTVTGLTQGTYKFQLKVTDNNGSTGLDTIQVTVNAENGLLPAVNPANAVNGLDYKYFENSSGWSVVPVFSTLTPVKTGTTTNFNTQLANRATAFSFEFTGFVNVPVDGQYTFYTTSDDGSKLYIDNVLVVNNDGLHGAIEKSGTIGLKAGKHAISVGFFQQGGGNTLNVSYSGTGISKQAVPSSALYRISPIINAAIISPAKIGVQAYPNPFANYINVSISDSVAGKYKLILFDDLGRVVWTKSGIKNTGDFQELIQTSSLKNGIYFLQVIHSNNNAVIKLVK